MRIIGTTVIRLNTRRVAHPARGGKMIVRTALALVNDEGKFDPVGKGGIIGPQDRRSGEQSAQQSRSQKLTKPASDFDHNNMRLLQVESGQPRQ